MIFYLIFLSFFFLPVAAISFIYMLIGIRQLVAGYRENSTGKKKAGWITLAVTSLIFFATVYYYLSILFSFGSTATFSE